MQPLDASFHAELLSCSDAHMYRTSRDASGWSLFRPTLQQHAIHMVLWFWVVLTVSSCCRLLREGQVPFIETVPFQVIAAFTVLQFVSLAAVYVVSSWTGVSL